MTVDLARKGPKRNSPAWWTAVRQRELQAVELHLAGVTYDRIAEQLGFEGGRGGAHKAVSRLLARQENEAAEEMKQTAGAQLRRLMVAVMPKAVAGDLKACSELRRLNESWRRLYGLDSPFKVEQVRSEVDEKIMELTRQLGGTIPPPPLEERVEPGAASS